MQDTRVLHTPVTYTRKQKSKKREIFDLRHSGVLFHNRKPSKTR